MAFGPEFLRVYIDANVLVTGIATEDPFAASPVLLANDIAPIELIISEVGVDEARRNVEQLVADGLQELDTVIKYCVTVVPSPSLERRRQFFRRADVKDAAHLASAVDHDCRYLATYNTSDFEPGHPKVRVEEPGELVRRMREIISANVFLRHEEW
jgi:predicted nucleic acid-binding protein